jgi:hypothetical protein
MNASRLQRTKLWSVTDRLQFYIRPVVQAIISLLALMESADPRLISPVDSKSKDPFRLGGPRSDLFAITLFYTLRNLYGIPS